MTPLYDGRENHYKKMLDLQEKLRKSEEERIRLEERFNLLVQESRNRHQACINRLRISYAEFLEEQRARDERNNKLLGTLDKVDSSLALMTAKTERLNVLRKQYEAYLLRAYGAQRYNGSVAADSGLESQHEQEISPSPILSKSALGLRKSVFPTSHDFTLATYKTSSTNGQKALDSYQVDTVAQEKPSPVPDTIKSNVYEKPIKNVYENLFDSIKLSPYKPPDIYRDLDLNGYPATSSPMLTENPNEILKTSAYLPMNLDACLKLNGSSTDDSPKKEVELKTTSTKLPGLRPLTNFALDSYLGKVRRMHANWLERRETKPEPKPEPEVDLSAEEVEQEQNTSGDLLNVSMSEDGFESSAEEEARERSRARTARFRQAFAAQSLSSRGRLPDLSEKANELRLTGRSFDAADEGSKFNPSRIDLGQFSRSQEPVDEVFAKLAELSEPRRLIQQNRALLTADEVVVPLEASHQDLNDPLLRESSVDEEREGDGDGCIEDDYDDTVDIDSWMPDDSEKRQEEPLPELEPHARLRRKLESIEEVEQTEDEELADEVEEAASLSEGLEAVAVTPVVQLAEEVGTVQNLRESTKDSSLDQHSAHEDNASSDFDQAQVVEQFQFPGFEPYSNYEYQQYESQRNQAFAAIRDMKHQEGYKGYPDISPSGPGTSVEIVEEKQSDQKQEYSPMAPEEVDLEDSPERQARVVEVSARVAEERSVDSSPEKSVERSAEDERKEQANPSESASSHPSNTPEKSSSAGKESRAPAAKEPKKKKDPIKTILDSDSESFIERNLSNTESDFDFN